MEIKDKIFQLRKSLGLSQDDFAGKLFVTRQAVSRWENGETVPNTDTLKLISEVFHVSVDSLLGQPVKQCQSCGMILELDSDKGTELDGSKTEEFCSFCFQNGAFVHSITMDEMIEHNLQDLDEWNKEAGLQLTKPEARTMLKEFLPTLKRWQA